MANKVIKNINYNQKEILADIIKMHCDGKPFDCDMTYSKGCFYDGGIVPQPKYKFDVMPQDNETIKIESDGRLPLEDNSIDSIVIDLPFLCTKGPSLKEANNGSNVITRRFNYYPNFAELFKSYKHWLNDAYRVLRKNGKCIFKCQNVISSGKYYCTEEITWQLAHEVGFYTLDRFILLAKQRMISSKHSNQKHARNYSSVFWVFEKGVKQIDYNKLLKETKIEEDVLFGGELVKSTPYISECKTWVDCTNPCYDCINCPLRGSGNTKIVSNLSKLYD